MKVINITVLQDKLLELQKEFDETKIKYNGPVKQDESKSLYSYLQELSYQINILNEILKDSEIIEI